MFFEDESGAVGIAFGLPIQPRIQVQAGIPVVPVNVRHGETGGSFLPAVDADQGVQVELRFEEVGGQSDAPDRIVEAVLEVLVILPRRQRDFDRIVHADLGMLDFQGAEFLVVEDEVRVHRNAQLRQFEIVETPFVVADGVDPVPFGLQFLLFEPAEIGLCDPALSSQCARSLRVFPGALQVQKTVADRIAAAQDAIIRAGDLDAETFAELHEVAQGVEQAAFSLGEILDFLFEPGVPEQRTQQCGVDLGRGRIARAARKVAGQKVKEIGGKRGRDAPHVADEPTDVDRTVGVPAQAVGAECVRAP